MGQGDTFSSDKDRYEIKESILQPGEFYLWFFAGDSRWRNQGQIVAGPFYRHADAAAALSVRVAK